MFRPVAATAFDGAILLTDRDDARLLIDMPTPEGARFCAAALENEFRRARRAGE
ncbi:hypothetical protein [Roseivivax isoporae]|uniref:Uncharacterized protein n=1 Tax=Roseivivax isoporae LMG 25204 TaxID=1449351 RepID=X7F386_9RHOB|nr:hypothetical protein [Roseivivax isoporae]ETX26504.1 hypothetical protein RISW2_23845 [Roseivivax isoporae LMG 25204]